MTQQQNENFDICLGLNEVDVEKVGASKEVALGKCQLQIQKCVPGQKPGSFTVVSLVLAHDNPKSVGLTCYDFFNLEGRGAERTANLFIETGVATRQQLLDAKNSHGGTRVGAGALRGRIYFVEIKPNTYNGVTRNKPDWNLYGPNNPVIVEKKFPYSTANVPAAVKNQANATPPSDAVSSALQTLGSTEEIPF